MVAGPPPSNHDAVVGTAGVALAGTDEFSWTDPNGGDWNDATNWTSSTGTPPPNLPTDIVTFDLASTYNVRFQSGINNASLTVSSGTVQLDLFDINDSFLGFNYGLVPAGGDAIVVGTTTGSSATLIATNGEDAEMGGLVLQGPAVIGRDAGSFGRLDLQASMLNPSHPIYVGLDGEGELSVFTLGGSLEISSTETWIGFSPGSMGTVSFAEATWDNSGTFNVGGCGSGAFSYSGGLGLNCDGDFNVAVDPGSSGVVTQEATLDANASVYVGGSAVGPGGVGQWNCPSAGRLNVGQDFIIWPQGTFDGCSAAVGGNLEIWPGGTLQTGAFDFLSVDGTFLNRGSSNVSIGRDLIVTGAFQMLAGSTLVFDGDIFGELSVPGLDDAPPGSINWTSGNVTITAGDLMIGADQPLGANVSVHPRQTLVVEIGTLSIGPGQAGTLTIDDALVESVHGVIGGSSPGDSGASVAMLASADWRITGDLTIADTDAASLQISDDSVLTNHNAFIASASGTTAAVTVTGATAIWRCSGSLYLGGTDALIGGTGRIDIDDTAGLFGLFGGLSVAGTLKVWTGSVIEAVDGRIFVSELEIAGGIVDAGAIPIHGAFGGSAGTISVFSGGQLIGDVSDDGGGWSIALQDPGSMWSMSSSHRISNTAQTDGVGLISDLSIGDGTLVTTSSTVTVDDAADLTISGGTLAAKRIQLSQTFTGHGTLDGEVISLGLIVATGDIELGDATSFNGVRFTEGIDVGAHTVTAHHNGPIELGWVTTLDGGVLQAAEGFVMDSANFLVGNGTVAGRFVGGAGSTILATGPLSIGDPSSVVGFSNDGDLFVHDHTVNLLDANGANLGILSVLGLDGLPGTLSASSGAFIGFEDNVIGYGVIDTPNDPFMPLINNGAIVGDSPAENIELSGYVRGFGTLDNVVITGTDAPGLSTAQVYRGNVTYQGTLEIEIGGTTPGGLHDQVNHSGLAELGGSLDIQLANSYEPALDTHFDILTYAAGTGNFTAVFGMGIAPGKVFRPDATFDRMTLVVAEPLAQDQDEDGDADLADFSEFAPCVSGPSVPPSVVCATNDYDLDANVDLLDFSIFQRRFSGPDMPAFPD